MTLSFQASVRRHSPFGRGVFGGPLKCDGSLPAAIILDAGQKAFLNELFE